MICGFINIYRYDTGRIHPGTGFYISREVADSVSTAKRKRRIACVPVLIEEVEAEYIECNGGYTDIRSKK